MLRFSIVIPTFNRPAALTRCLSSLANLDFPRDRFEVVVVDDGSPTPAVAPESLPSNLALRLLRQANAGPAKARNRGAQEARGELLAFLDDDCTPHSDWLTRLDAAATRHPGAMLGGVTNNAVPNNLFAMVNQRLLDSVNEWFHSTSSPLRFFTSNNIVAPAQAFRDRGGFNPTFQLAAGEDRELCARWLRQGGELITVPEARINHFHGQTIRTFLNMHFRYGRGAAQLHRSQHTSPGQFVQKGLYGHLLRGFLRSGRPFISTFLFLTAQAATAAGYFYESRRALSPATT